MISGGTIMRNIFLSLMVLISSTAFSANIEFKTWDGSITPKDFYDNRCSISRAATGGIISDCGQYALIFKDGDPYYYHDQVIDPSVIKKLNTRSHSGGETYQLPQYLFYWYFGNIDNPYLADNSNKSISAPATVSITKCEKSSNGNIKIVSTTPHGLSDGEVVYIDKSNGIDGVWRVEGISVKDTDGKPYTNASTFILKGSANNNCSSAGGTFKRIAKGIVNKEKCASKDCYKYIPNNYVISGEIEKTIHDCVGNLMTNIVKSSYDKMNKSLNSYNKKILKNSSLKLPDQAWITNLLYSPNYALNGLKIYNDVIDQVHQRKFQDFVFVSETSYPNRLRCMINKDVAVEWIAPPVYYVDNGNRKYIYDGKLGKEIEPDKDQEISPSIRYDGNVFGVVNFVYQPANPKEPKKIAKGLTYNFYDYTNKDEPCTLKTLQVEEYKIEVIKGANELIVKFKDPYQPQSTTKCYAKASDAQGLQRQQLNSNSRVDIKAAGQWCPAINKGDDCI